VGEWHGEGEVLFPYLKDHHPKHFSYDTKGVPLLDLLPLSL